MFNVLFEKCADWLMPIIAGCTVWYALHYFVLAPRIITVDTKNHFIHDQSLPANVNNCLKANIANEMLAIGRFEAALYTATLKHISEPLQQKHNVAIASLDSECGVTLARQRQRERDAALSAEMRRKAEAARKQQELKNTIQFWSKLLMGGK